LPDTGAEVVAGMDPYATYPAFARLINGDETWYQIEEGWAAGWVVRLGGQCDGLTEITFGPAFDGSFFDVFQGISPLNAPVPHSGGLLPAVQFGNLLPAVSPQFCDGSVRPVFADLGNNSESGSPSCAFSLNGGEINLLFLTQDGFDALPASLGDGNPNGILIGLLQPAAQVALADGSVKLGDVNLDSILIGLSPKPDSAAFGDGSVVPSDTNGILIGLLLPAVQRTLGDGSATSGDTNGILIGLLLPAVQTALGDGSATSGDTNGILIGLLLPAVQTALGDGSATSGDTNGILIGLLLPAVQKATEGGPDSEAFSFDVFVPGGGAFNLNFSLTGDHMEVHAFDLFTPGPGGEIFSLNFPMPGGAA
jgi:hypothetical protein